MTATKQTRQKRTATARCVCRVLRIWGCLGLVSVYLYVLRCSTPPDKTSVLSAQDEEAELLAELDRIRQERAEAAAQKAAEEAAEAEKALQSEVLHGNPLLQAKLAASVGTAGGAGASFAVKRRWDDDVVFRNQARSEPKAQRRFINDTIRNDFHRRFLDRYMK